METSIRVPPQHLNASVTFIIIKLISTAYKNSNKASAEVEKAYIKHLEWAESFFSIKVYYMSFFIKKK